jgi:H+/Cl- antiporter ClcA
MSLLFMPFKFLATALSSISGIPGGLFSPSLSVGAGLGADIAWFFPSTPIGVLILLGMVSYFTGVVQAPITAFVIVAEMTDNHNLMAPLMLSALIAQGASRLVCKEGVYHALALKFVPKPVPEPDPTPDIEPDSDSPASTPPATPPTPSA